MNTFFAEGLFSMFPGFLTVSTDLDERDLLVSQGKSAAPQMILCLYQKVDLEVVHIFRATPSE